MTPPSAVSNGVTVHGVTDTTSVTIPNPLTVAGVVARRERSAPLKAGIAAATSSDAFKTKVRIPVYIAAARLRGWICREWK